eukprot:NODE_529_length_1592_cov_158.437459_g383_i0.p1 GENE.NODE_529_length_1592_cov_158.437459_g383_i0~~NODE_529_length_1592_cov_158.437459_g383_i0.p1  ORF type:complete len:415 (-),score=106.33 NODE_529_length_1592_cov_158.437459_g383_i0:276-1520(-)
MAGDCSRLKNNFESNLVNSARDRMVNNAFGWLSQAGYNWGNHGNQFLTVGYDPQPQCDNLQPWWDLNQALWGDWDWALGLFTANNVLSSSSGTTPYNAYSSAYYQQCPQVFNQAKNWINNNMYGNMNALESAGGGYGYGFQLYCAGQLVLNGGSGGGGGWSESRCGNGVCWNGAAEGSGGGIWVTQLGSIGGGGGTTNVGMNLNGVSCNSASDNSNNNFNFNSMREKVGAACGNVRNDQMIFVGGGGGGFGFRTLNGVNSYVQFGGGFGFSFAVDGNGNTPSSATLFALGSSAQATSGSNGFSSCQQQAGNNCGTSWYQCFCECIRQQATNSGQSWANSMKCTTSTTGYAAQDDSMDTQPDGLGGERGNGSAWVYVVVGVVVVVAIVAIVGVAVVVRRRQAVKNQALEEQMIEA